jgi:lysophospholipase L1-like esterase
MAAAASSLLQRAFPYVLGLALLAGCGNTQDQSLATEVERFVVADRIIPPAACQVLFVGSSSIVRWDDSLAADMAPMPVINRGFGGSQIADVNRWFDKIVAPYRPRAIVFYAGDNDIDAGKSIDRVVADFDTFMTLKSRILGATPVYFISIKPSKARIAQLPRQAIVNDAIRARAAARADLHFLDVAPLMLADGKPRDIFVADGLHMNRQGYLIWTQVVRPALLVNTEAEERSCAEAK